MRCDRRQAEGAVPHRPLQRRQDVRTRVGRRQRQDALGLVLAEAVPGEQALQEPRPRRAELREPLGQLLPSPLGVSGRLVVLATAALSRGGPREEPMPRRLDERPVMDDQLVLGHAHRDALADQPPGRRVEVLAVDHEPLGVDGAVHDLGGVERPRRQRQQVGPFLGVAVDRPRLGLAVLADVGDLGQPPGRGLVQVPQAAEGPAAQQARFDISEGPLDLPLRLRPPGPAGHRPEAVVGRERQEPRVVDRLVAVVAADDDLHVVIEARRRDPAQVLEGADVLADGRGEVLRLDEAEVLPPRVAQHVAEGVNAAAAFVAEVEVIRGVIHLGLLSRRGLEPPHGGDHRARAQAPHPFGEDRVTPRVTAPAQFLVDPLGGDVGIARQQVDDHRFVRVEQAAARPAWPRRRRRRRGPARPAGAPCRPCGD